MDVVSAAQVKEVLSPHTGGLVRAMEFSPLNWCLEVRCPGERGDAAISYVLSGDQGGRQNIWVLKVAAKTGVIIATNGTACDAKRVLQAPPPPPTNGEDTLPLASSLTSSSISLPEVLRERSLALQFFDELRSAFSRPDYFYRITIPKEEHGWSSFLLRNTPRPALIAGPLGVFTMFSLVTGHFLPAGIAGLLTIAAPLGSWFARKFFSSRERQNLLENILSKATNSEI